MKIKKGFMLVPTLDYFVVVSTGQLEKEFNGIIKLNETSADIWRFIDQGLTREEVIERFAATYGVGIDVATSDVDQTIANMQAAGVFE